ncbi:MAG: CidA/LrgA family protein [bacterium]
MSASALRFVTGIAILVALDAAGGWLVRLTHAPVPGSVVGMLALTVLVETRVLPLAAVRSAADFLVRYIALLFVPAGVAIVVYGAVLRQSLVAIIVAAVLSLVAVLVVVGRVAQHLEGDA